MNVASQNLRARHLIDARTLAEALRSEQPPVVLAVRAPDVATEMPFDQWPRIPGAHESDLATDFAAPGGGVRGSRPLPRIEQLQDRVRGWGIDLHTPVVVYDHSGGLQAARAWWILRWAGLEQVRVLDGGYAAWAALSDYPLPDKKIPARLGTALLQAGHMPQIDADQAQQWIHKGVLLDTRIAPNYEGGPSAVGEPARGHIPGAINVPAADNLDQDGRLLANEHLQRHFSAVGITPQTPTAVYCGAGVSAAHAILALACLGIDAPMYVGSWSAWSADPERPVEQGSSPR